MNILGLSGALGHDPSAALLVDGEIVAAVEEERLLRDKHAKNRMPIESARYCLAEGKVDPSTIDVVAVPFAPISIWGPARWHYARRYWYAPDRALVALLNGNHRYRRYRDKIMDLGHSLGIDWTRTRFEPVEHHLAHASSAYHLSGFSQPTAIMCVDGKGEYATTFLGIGENGRIRCLKEFYDPDSLGGVYGAFTEYLGFEMLDGEYKVMGMAPYGRSDRIDLNRLIEKRTGGFRANTRYVNTVGLRRYKENGKGYYFSQKLVDWLGPRRSDDDADEPYIHYAAAMQKLFEDRCLDLVDDYLEDTIHKHGSLAIAGGGALNVKLNQRLLDRPSLQQLFVQPAAGDAGTALGAATYVASEMNEPVGKLQHVYLGPQFSREQILTALQSYSGQVRYEELTDVPRQTAEILNEGNPVAWFQGRMEFGPRALGARSILGCPTSKGISDRINSQIKFRERWRPFCPSVLDRLVPAITGKDHPAPYMTITFAVTDEWRCRVPEVVHVDGTARIHAVDQVSNPRFYQLLEEMEQLTGNGVVLNTSLNRRGEPMICSPEDALNMFTNCDLQYLVIGDILVTKLNLESNSAQPVEPIEEREQRQ